MAERKLATVRVVHPVGARSARIELQMTVGGLDAKPGQYIIVDTGLPKGDGKTHKRAYSLLATDPETGRFELAVREVAGGVGSRFMTRVEPGADLPLSGPWGKWVPRDDDPPGDTLIVATDTGITAALGLLGPDGLAPRRELVTVVWCVPAPDYFLRVGWVCERAGCRVQLAVVPPADNPDRLPAALRAVRGTRSGAPPVAAYLVGDGAVVAELGARLAEGGTDPERIYTEYFFNNPRRAT